MSMMNRPANGTDLGEMVASTRDYEVAQKTVSKLIAGEIPARDIAIVGQGVRTVERVTGKLGYAAAARSGAINGVLIGLVLSAIMLFGNSEAPVSLFLGFILIGVALGMIMSLVTYSIVRRRRDFASMTQMLADHYEVRVQPASLAKAREVMGAERTVTPRPAVDLSKPPQYGERIPVPGSDAGEQTPPAVRETPPADPSAQVRTAEPEVGEADAADAADAAQQGAAPEQGADAQPAQRDGTEPEAR
ncbi:general stress protein [Microbacterium suwonense]|uniref:general stress protein n=1 Tax=Microbacterium suwonense TaxID=683047 RepID=UPI0036194B38